MICGCGNNGGLTSGGFTIGGTGLNGGRWTMGDEVGGTKFCFSVDGSKTI